VVDNVPSTINVVMHDDSLVASERLRVDERCHQRRALRNQYCLLRAIDA
jgi:hypothetical protein